jgi:CRP/FNR family transcriptional regulator, cyclic AMP receptor protein
MALMAPGKSEVSQHVPGPHQVCSFVAGEVIYQQGEPARSAYFIEQGQVRIFARAGGAERNLRVVGADDLFGVSALVPPAEYEGTAIAVTDLRAIRFDLGSLAGLVRHLPAIGAKLIVRLAERTREAEERIEISLLRDSQSKVVAGLIRAARGPAANTPDGSVALGLSPLALSARVGLDVAAVKRAVQQLRDARYVELQDEQLLIPNLPALQELHNLLETGEEILGGEAR